VVICNLSFTVHVHKTVSSATLALQYMYTKHVICNFSFTVKFNAQNKLQCTFSIKYFFFFL